MASLQERNGSYRVQFFFHGKLHGFTIGKVTVAEAEAKTAQVDYLLMRLKQKLITLPPGTDIVAFVQHDGAPPAAPSAPDVTRRGVSLARLKDAYLTTHGNGTLETSSLATCRIHLSHLCRVLGDAFPLAELTLADVQGYINKRKVAPITVRKEVTTFRSAWNWGTSMGLMKGVFPSKGLRYAKTDEKCRQLQDLGPDFQDACSSHPSAPKRSGGKHDCPFLKRIRNIRQGWQTRPKQPKLIPQ
jgi:hypothetical protein